MANCVNLEDNKAKCTCTYDPCPRKGNCCACIAYHKNRNELPGCLFSPETERTYNRSVAYFVKTNS